MRLIQNGKVVRVALALLCGVALLCAMSSCGRWRGAKKKEGKPEVTATQAQEPAATGETAAGKPEIFSLSFSLPEQVKWAQNQDESLERAGIAEFYMESSTPEASPARVLYQRLMPAQDKDALRERITSPLKQCADSRVEDFPGTSRYRDQINFQGLCSRMDDADYGLMSYVSVFSDATANHMVMAEVRTPPAAKAGTLTFKDAEMQKQAQTSKALFDMLHKTMQSIRVCDEKNRCI